MHVRSSRQLLGSMRRQRPYDRSPSGDSREPPCNGIRTIHVERLAILQNVGQLRLYQELTFGSGITAPSLVTEMKSRLIDVVGARCRWDTHTTGVIGEIFYNHERANSSDQEFQLNTRVLCFPSFEYNLSSTAGGWQNENGDRLINAEACFPYI